MADFSSDSHVMIASGRIEEPDDVFAFNAALAGLSFSGWYSARVVAPAAWPSMIAGATGFELVSPDTLYNAWHDNNTVIGPLGAGALSAVVSGIWPNPIHDAILSGNPVLWEIYRETPGSVETQPALSGNLASDLIGGWAKGVGDTVGAGGAATGDAVTKGGELAGKAGEELVKRFPWAPFLVAGAALLFIGRKL